MISWRSPLLGVKNACKEESLPARAPINLAERLAREFAAPVGLVDPSLGKWSACVGPESVRLPRLDSELVTALTKLKASPERVAIWHPPQDLQHVWLVLNVPVKNEGDCLYLLGFRSIESSGATPGWGPFCPVPALMAWGREVAARLVVESGGSATGLPRVTLSSPGGELQLVTRLIRRLKISDPPERFQNLAAFALQSAMKVEAVAWVPESGRERVIVGGGIAGFRSADYRAIVSELSSQQGSIRIVNDRPKGEPVRRIAGVEVSGLGVQGWFVALNPMDNRCFSHVEIELLEPVASLLATQHDNARLYGDLKDLLFGVIRALTAAIDAKDRYTSGHSERVARIAVRLACAMGMPPKQQNDLYLMGLLHDIGKIGIDDGLLKKAGSLTKEEYRVVQSHVEIGVNILRDLNKLRHLLPGVQHHHERYDGGGYPFGLRGEDIPLEARILAVADTFDALTSTRPYRDRKSPQEIDAILREGAGIQWDAKVVEALFSCREDVEGIRSIGLGESLQVVIDDTVGRHN
ncbi:HD-GYP domain-containing protein [Singulisphaera sp. PoT]|uniref:HD-GYP domain-containing protein n=1 Tax=Singulisphaera sp. PoT TaxID=3411797 RepID=UPI003BF4F51A